MAYDASTKCVPYVIFLRRVYTVYYILSVRCLSDSVVGWLVDGYAAKLKCNYVMADCGAVVRIMSVCVCVMAGFLCIRVCVELILRRHTGGSKSAL